MLFFAVTPLFYNSSETSRATLTEEGELAVLLQWLRLPVATFDIHLSKKGIYIGKIIPLWLEEIRHERGNCRE